LTAELFDADVGHIRFAEPQELEFPMSHDLVDEFVGGLGIPEADALQVGECLEPLCDFGFLRVGVFDVEADDSSLANCRGEKFGDHVGETFFTHNIAAEAFDTSDVCGRPGEETIVEEEQHQQDEEGD